jgi:hypothetical protein
MMRWCISGEGIDMSKLPLACAVVVLVVLGAGHPAFSQNTPVISFFITSGGSGNGANLGGLAGADAICQRLAATAGAGGKTWRAYLSSSAAGNQAAVNARDRIGRGPWQNAKGVVVAQSVDDLHSDNNKLGKENSLTEKGTMVNGRGDNPNTHDMLTGSGLDGRALPGDNTCNNWTSAGAGAARVGHHDKQGGGENPNSWNSAHASSGCSQANLVGTGGAGLFYCFAQ